MRPVQLQMDGFAAFREATTVDFTDADYFVLVGPTGSGKSTVIDAMTFALYGSVPRWSDRRAVRYGLAPTAVRGAVKLIFDADGRRYAVARELRRAKNGTVAVRNARLERFTDPKSLGEDDDFEQLAADSAVTPAVEALLGLTFDHFCQTVVLPQGAFSEFLRAQGSERREMLLKLLGAGLYDQMRTAANQRAAMAEQRVSLIDQQLVRLGAASDREIDTAEQHIAALADLGSRLPGLLQAISSANSRQDTAIRQSAEAADDIDLLTSTRAPDGLDDLARSRVQADERLVSAREAETAAIAADTAARERLVAAPARAPLEQWARDHVEQATLAAEIPGTRRRAEETAARANATREARMAAAAGLEVARIERDETQVAAASATAMATNLQRECEMLAAVRTPNEVAAHGATLRDAVEAAAGAESALQHAEETSSKAQAALEAAPPRGPLERALALFDSLAATQATRDVRADALAAADSTWDEAQAKLKAARTRRDGARSSLESERATHGAAALRSHLVIGKRCPVCDQPVDHLPESHELHELAAAERAMSEAESAVTAAAQSEREANTVAATARAGLINTDDRLAELTVQLVDAPADRAATQATLNRREEAEAAAQRATAALRDATDADRRTRKAVDDARSAGSKMRAAFSAARDPLVPLGAPDPRGDDLATDWQALVSWAKSGADERRKHLPGARENDERAHAAATSAQASFVEAESIAEHRRNAETTAVADQAASLAALDGLEMRSATLAKALADAPDATAIAVQLANLDELERVATAADLQLRIARVARDEATVAVDEQSRAADAAWQELRAARDRLMPLRPPVLRDAAVSDGWHTLVTWSERRTAEIHVERDRAEQEARSAGLDVADRQAELRSAFAAVDIAVPDVEASSVNVAHATALTRAKADHTILTGRRDEHKRLTDDRSTSVEEQQVAATLGLLLRTNRFPEWLERSVLDGLVVEASRNLTELSSGQFSLTHQSGEFFVIDHADADSERSVRTLSGGETFQASLALALALSAQLSTLAVAGAAKLESIFLDEGFGTLDQDSLEVVAGTLENLAKGERMVGIITHVAALADRVPVRFTVRRDDRSSYVERETP